MTEITPMTEAKISDITNKLELCQTYGSDCARCPQKNACVKHDVSFIQEGEYEFNSSDILETTVTAEEVEDDFDYVICYEDFDGSKWETISGEDAMQVRVNELTRSLDCDPEDIMVFEIGSQL